MNDPWDVKSVRRSTQYMSCMKINGIPLLPPLLSRECREEMQYYKLLAKEVERRISVLQPYVPESDTDSSDDKTDAPELPECEQNYELSHEDTTNGFHLDFNKINALVTEDGHNETIDNISNPPTNLFNSITSNVTVVETGNTASGGNSPKLIIDLSLNIDGSIVPKSITKKSFQRSSQSVDLPERDNSNKSNIFAQKELITEYELASKSKKGDKSPGSNINFKPNFNKDAVSEPYPDLSLSQDGPSSLSAKSFTGSLNDIHTDSMKESQVAPKLIRQRSYTLLKPSPQLLAHLEAQSLSTGVEMSLISMSESLSNLSTPYKKRRSWDLESAKVKWSSMAMELKEKQISTGGNCNTIHENQSKRSVVRKSPQISPTSTKSGIIDKVKQSFVKTLPKSEPIQKGKKILSPVRNTNTNMTVAKEPIVSKPTNQNIEPSSPKYTIPLISEYDDPAARVRELYEKIQAQQLIQMANLAEKQKKEQMLLQQVFEEQNNLLIKQLKTVCPKSPTDLEELWHDKPQNDPREPVSLSQLINHKSSDQSLGDRSVSTLTDTNHYLSQCDKILKVSRDITCSIKKQQPKVLSQNGTKVQAPRAQNEGSRTRTHSPSQRNSSISRRLNYDVSATSEHEYEPTLTDRTNDTMADLNVTFPSDNSDECRYNKNIVSQLYGKEASIRSVESTPPIAGRRSTDSGIRDTEKTTVNVIGNVATRLAKFSGAAKRNPPTAKELAAATKIVAHAKGYLVRRLMRTERVQGIVQTIKDALLCALQLHQDREGIRGADVDLHRRLIQQITAACYSLHDTFITSTPAERCAMIKADRGRRLCLAARQPPKTFRQTDRMSQSYSGAIPSRNKRPTASSLMTQSNYETFSGKCTPVSRSRHMSSPQRRPWR